MCFFRDISSWGRRAPLFLVAIPVCMASTLLSWIGPESLENSFAVAVWYAVIRFSITTGTAMFEAAFQAAFTELFPSEAERVRIGLEKFFCGILGTGVGSIVIGTSALGVKDPGSARQRLFFCFLALITTSVWLMAVPYACLQRRSIMKKVVTQSASSWSGMREIWSSSVPFRFFAVATHFFSAALALTLSGLPFYLEVALGYTPDQVEVAMRVILIGSGIMIPISLPLVNFASQRIDPSKLAGFGGLLCIIISICHAHASFGIKGRFGLQVAQLSVICGAGVGVLSVSWVSAQSALFTYIVDDDQVRQAERDGVLDRQEVGIDELPARRDGLINSFKSCFSISGAAWAGVLQLLLGILGYDGENYINSKP